MIDLNHLARMVFMVPAVLVVGMVRLIKPVFLVRFGILQGVRIGHFAANTEVYLCEREAGMQPRGFLGGIDLWAYKGNPCNIQFARMVQRSLWVDRTGFVKLLAIANHCFNGWEKHVAGSEQHDRDIHNLMEKQKPHIRFNERELAFGKEQLARMGITGKWVCLIVRDGAYLDHPSFNYHRHRDTKINTYAKAVLALAERGYYVVRMGAVVKEPLKVTHPRIIDYATNGMRSDFMDIYLMAHCELAVSSGTGLDSVAAIFRRPICFVNYVPVEYMNTWVCGVLIWQHHFRRGKRMTPEQIWKSGAGQFMQAEEYRRKRISLRHNTPDEIMDAVLEMENGRWNVPEKQETFWRNFPYPGRSTYNDKPLHGEIRLRIGSKFLQQYLETAAQ